MHSENEGKRGESAPRQLSGRGVAYWSDGRNARIVYVTPGYRLIALDAKTGVPIPGFGRNGVVDLKDDNDQDLDLITGEIGLHAAPMVAQDVIIVGAAHLSGATPKSRANAKGYVRAFDVRTGKRLWTFHTIPKPGEFGFNTWEGDSAQYPGNTGMWAMTAVDEELGLAYLPVEMPTGDYYGGHRPGAGLFGESLVAVELRTGKRRWHYQLVHHGIWDFDIPSPPILIDIVVDGKPIKAVAQPTKQAWLYVFDRATGQPVWPIEERAVDIERADGERRLRRSRFVTSHRRTIARGRRSRPDRLHTGAEGRGRQAGSALQAGPAVHASCREPMGRPDGDAHAAVHRRRRKLAGRSVRSRNEHAVRALDHDAGRIGPGRVRRQELRHGVYPRHGA